MGLLSSLETPSSHRLQTQEADAPPLESTPPRRPLVVLRGLCALEVHPPLTVLHLGAELALLGILKDRVVAGLCALHGTVAAGFVKEGSISTRRRAAQQPQ